MIIKVLILPPKDQIYPFRPLFLNVHGGTHQLATTTCQLICCYSNPCYCDGTTLQLFLLAKKLWNGDPGNEANWARRLGIETRNEADLASALDVLT